MNESVTANLRKIEAYAPLYICDQASSENRARLLGDWWAALIFWFGHSFYRGRSDSVSEIFEVAAEAVLEDVLGADKSTALDALGAEDFSVGDPLDSLLRSRGVPHRGDRAMVLASLKLVQRIPDHNIVAYSLQRIEHGELVDLYEELDELPWVGDKLASFYIRDLELFFDIRPFLEREDYVRMQPLDTWAAEVALRLGLMRSLPTADGLIAVLLSGSACLSYLFPPPLISDKPPTSGGVAVVWYILGAAHDSAPMRSRRILLSSGVPDEGTRHDLSNQADPPTARAQ